MNAWRKCRGDDLERVKSLVDFEMFREALEAAAPQPGSFESQPPAIQSRAHVQGHDPDPSSDALLDERCEYTPFTSDPEILWMTRKLSVTESRKPCPVLGDFVAQEIERGVREMSACGVAFVVREMCMRPHNPRWLLSRHSDARTVRSRHSEGGCSYQKRLPVYIRTPPRRTRIWRP
jgi:hypothetical protein